MAKQTTKKKTATRKPAKKAPAKSKTPEVWACTADGWVKRGGKRYVKGDTILVFSERLSEKDLAVLKKYFEFKETEVMTGVSEPIELLDEGDDHGKN